MRSVLFFSRPRCECWPHHGRTVGRLLALPTLIWFDYSNALPDAHLLSELGLRASTLKAKFHYTGPTGPDRTRPDFVGDPHGPNGVSRRPGPQKSPCGSGLALVVEFSYKDAGIAQASERCQSIRLAEEMRIRQRIRLVTPKLIMVGMASSLPTPFISVSGAARHYV